MKYLLILIFAISSTVHSQELSYSIYLHDSCNDSIYKSTYFRLIPENEDFNSENGLECINGTCKVPRTGTYKLLLIENVEDTPQLIVLNERKTYSDTFNISLINEFVGTTTAGGYYGFRKCNSQCNGLTRDFYNNGNIRLEGNFVDGIPKGKLKIYYRNGKIKELREYSNRHKYKRVTFYNKKGEIVKTEKKGFRSEIIDPFSNNN